ncbi:hypothetical protein SPRG_09114 [Saprolegnia parasitica CBS 223.65]|uniref:Lipoxygenase domain-containing protein n=1 Tax=Saprolegnia parasitica (strain CBS 223.65) TaxID=695850 RepID=A0A067C3E5_SAPPC|nr:hypothetical protein SPRG_09114 [Saprolegnia parasitica CBS 223.65]KDO25284.1 hypothetical protein SPRG_09114 [Saprolegnia parasitica CBS 223.65]|eukprot:XP_012203942.1 hypothetical protein SPRG_09114 [Saprolegnia parasitica CBS 223.65]
MGNEASTVHADGAATDLPASQRAMNILKMIEFSKDPRAGMLESRDQYGDLFLLESHLVSEKIAGFCGPELLAAFDDKLRDGSIVREGAFPPGIVALLGAIMPTIDGEEHHARKAAALEAFTPARLDLYAPLVREIVQAEHASWAARGGAISLACLTREMVFRIFLKVLYGVERHDANKFRKRPDPHGVSCRTQILDELIRPAIADARARAATKTPAPSVIDCLVTNGKMASDVLETEAFHFLFAGFGGVACLATNILTAVATHPSARKDLLDARAEYVTKYDGEARWAHFHDLGYVNLFILEVKRFYVAGPTAVFGRAKTDLEIPTKNGVYKLPKGCLAAAGLEATNRHPDVWTDPNLFNPNRFRDLGHVRTTKPHAFCPHAFGALSHRRCAGEDLTTLILQSTIVSLFDFVWQMVPNQDYKLAVGVSTPTPVGQLMAVGFHRRTDDAAEIIGTVGSNADWKFLNLPESKELALWDRPYANQILSIPQHQKTLPKITLIQTHIEIATEDEDWPSQPWIEIQQSNFLRDYAPFVDNFELTWLPGEDMERYVMSKVGHMWPRVNVHWNDRYSDRALELLAFNGFGQHLLMKLPEAHDDGSYYGICLGFVKGLEVRPGYAKYGADVYFTAKGNVTKIVRGDITSRPGDAGWEYAKLCFRGSLQTKVTAVDHLLGIHATVANIMVIANREKLPPTHPLRRLIKPFTFRSVAINYGAGRALFWPKGMLQRAYALTDKGMKQTWDFGLANFKYETFPEHKARQNIDTTTLPFHEDGMDYWQICRSFVSNYVDLYFKSEDALQNDTDNLKDFVAHFIFLVSSMHNHLGTIAEYVSDPAFCPSAWVEGELAGRPGTGVRLALIMTATGFAQPAITEDFSHIMLDDAGKAVCQAFTAAVTAQIAVVDARNATRVQPYQSFNPKTMEMAVTVAVDATGSSKRR